jgi:ABC-type thiamine transport system substrate-binding protein
MHESWVAMIQAAQKKKESQKLFEFLFTDEIQKQIPLKNYMYPGVAKTILPKCFEKLGSSPTEAKLKTEIKGYSDFLIYLDRWSLLK